jgi:hypothetical protein
MRGSSNLPRQLDHRLFAIQALQEYSPDLLY